MQLFAESKFWETGTKGKGSSSSSRNKSSIARYTCIFAFKRFISILFKFLKPLTREHKFFCASKMMDFQRNPIPCHLFKILPVFPALNKLHPFPCLSIVAVGLSPVAFLLLLCVFNLKCFNSENATAVPGNQALP